MYIRGSVVKTGIPVFRAIGAKFLEEGIIQIEDNYLLYVGDIILIDDTKIKIEQIEKENG